MSDRFDDWYWSDDKQTPRCRVRLTTYPDGGMVKLSDEECNSRSEDAHPLRSVHHSAMALTYREAIWLRDALGRLLARGVPCDCCGAVIRRPGMCPPCERGKCGRPDDGEYHCGPECPRTLDAARGGAPTETPAPRSDEP